MTETLMKTVVDCSTGIESVIPLTSEEIEQREIDIAAAEADYVDRMAAAEAKAAAKASAEAKLTALGLTAEEIAALTK
jgi:hypothetical protein